MTTFNLTADISTDEGPAQINIALQVTDIPTDQLAALEYHLVNGNLMDGDFLQEVDVVLSRSGFPDATFDYLECTGITQETGDVTITFSRLQKVLGF